jgi:Flp pilus assembly pilin Flp
MLSVLARRLRRFVCDQRGTVFIEYSSLVLLVAIAAIAVISHIGAGSSN